MVIRLLAAYDGAPTGPDAFTDDDDSVHEAAINALASAGVIGGVSAMRFDPNGTVNRGAMASILARLQDFMVERVLSSPVGGLDTLTAPLMPGTTDLGHGQVHIRRTDVRGLLCVYWDIGAGPSSPVVSAHVHVGDATAGGPAVIALPLPAVTEGDAVIDISCQPGVDQGLIDQIFTSPASYFIDLETGSSTADLRGQLARRVRSLPSRLASRDEPTLLFRTNALADVELDVLSDGTICGWLHYSGSDETPLVASIHEGPEGALGPLDATRPPFNDIDISGCAVDVDPAVIARLLADPSDFYMAVSNDQQPDGGIRAQLQTIVELQATLTGPAVRPGPGDWNGAGAVSIEYSRQMGRLCLALNVRGIGAPGETNIHKGVAGTSGPVVAWIPEPTLNTISACLDLGTALTDAIAANPEQYYIEVTSAEYPGGAVRGQLSAGHG